MPQRAFNALWLVLGACTVVAIFLVGMRATDVARSGPAWRRRLVLAGLLLFAGLGFGACGNAGGKGSYGAAAGSGINIPVADNLESSRDWVELMAVWREVEQAISVPSPGITLKDKTRLLAALKKGQERIQSLAQTGLLSQEEAALLEESRSELASRATRLSAKDEGVISCYAPMPVGFEVKQSAQRLSARLPLLRGIAAAETLHPGVVVRVLSTIESDLAVLDRDQAVDFLPETDRAAAVKLRDDTREQVKAIRVRLASAPYGVESSPEWRQVVAAWREAEEVSSGKRGDYPFDQEGKKQLLDSLATVGGSVDSLLKRGLLNEAEAGLLKQDLAGLTRGVQAKRPVEMRMATCYRPMQFLPANESIERLSTRLPLLQKMAEQEKLDEVVVAKVLEKVETDIAFLESEENLQTLRGISPARAKEVRDAAREQVQRIRTRLVEKAGALEDSVDWKTVAEAWRAAAPLAESGRSTTAEREEAKKKLAAAREALQRLMAAGMLSKAEAGLLVSEAGRLENDIYRFPPTDSRVMCYDMAYLPPARQSFDRLSQRLPLLKEMATQRKLHPAALEKVIASIESDLEVLSDPAQLARMEPDRRAAAEEVRKQVEAALAEVRKVAGEAK